MVDTPEGPYWFCGRERWDPWGGRKGAAGAMGGRRLALERGGVLEPGVLRPTTTALRLADMDRDGVDATVMYGPIVPLLIEDPELRKVCYRAYNDWLAEFCATAPERLIGVGLIPIDDAESAAAGGALSEAHRPAYLHAAGGARARRRCGTRRGSRCGRRRPRPASRSAFTWAAGCARSRSSGPKAANPGNMGVRVSASPLQMDEALAAVIFSGALERYPSLKIVLAETGIGWLPYMLERMDDTYRKFLDAPDFWRSHSRLALAMAPSAYFRRQIWATFQSDHAGMRLLDVLGEDRVMWASDYPHADSTWPDSQTAIEDNFKSVPDRARRRILCENARQLYGLS